MSMSVLVALETGLKEIGWAIFVDGELSQTGRVAGEKHRSGDDDLAKVGAIVRALDDLAANWRPREVVYAEPFRNQWPVPALDALKEALNDWALRHKVSMFLYTPREVRAGIAGRANAPKEDLAYSVMKRWGLVGAAKSTAEWEAVAAGDYHLSCKHAGQMV